MILIFNVTSKFLALNALVLNALFISMCKKKSIEKQFL
jgi:hypothetical protein